MTSERKSFRNTYGPCLALCSLPLILVFGGIELLISLPAFLIAGLITHPILLKLSSSAFPFIVEFLYAWEWVGRIHLYIMKNMNEKNKRPFHSRFLDLRIDL